MFRQLFFIFLLFIPFITGFAQQNSEELPKTNYNAFSDVLNKGMTMIEDDVTILGKEKIYKMDAGPESETGNFFLNVCKQRFSAYRFVYDKGTDSIDYGLFVRNIKLGVEYSLPEGKSLLGDDFTVRKISASFSYSSGKPGNESNSRNFSDSFKDTVNVKYLDYIQNSGFAFMNSELPEKSFFRKAFVPAVVVLVSAATVILFFTIRSK